MPQYGDLVPIQVDIRRESDGVVRTVASEGSWDDGRDWSEGVNLFIWQEGNQACDCSRAADFARAGGETDPDRPCGSSAYTIRIRDAAGAVLYSEWE